MRPQDAIVPYDRIKTDGSFPAVFLNQVDQVFGSRIWDLKGDSVILKSGEVFTSEAWMGEVGEGEMISVEYHFNHVGWVSTGKQTFADSMLRVHKQGYYFDTVPIPKKVGFNDVETYTTVSTEPAQQHAAMVTGGVMLSVGLPLLIISILMKLRVI